MPIEPVFDPDQNQEHLGEQDLPRQGPLPQCDALAYACGGPQHCEGRRALPGRHRVQPLGGEIVPVPCGAQTGVRRAENQQVRVTPPRPA